MRLTPDRLRFSWLALLLPLLWGAAPVPLGAEDAPRAAVHRFQAAREQALALLQTQDEAQAAVLDAWVRSASQSDLLLLADGLLGISLERAAAGEASVAEPQLKLQALMDGLPEGRAHQGIGLLLERWRAADAEALARERRLRAAVFELAELAPANTKDALAYLEPLATQWGQGGIGLCATWLSAQRAQWLRQAGRDEEAYAAYQQARDLARDCLWLAVESSCGQPLAMLANNLWRYREALAHADDFLPLARELNNPIAIAFGLRQRALALYYLGRLEEAQEAALDALGRFDALKESRAIAQTLLQLGDNYRERGMTLASREAFERVRQAAGNAAVAGLGPHALLGLAHTLQVEGRYAEALSLAEQVLEASPQQHLQLRAQAISLRGAIQVRLGRPSLAEPLLREALRMHREQRSARSVASALNNLGACLQALDRTQEALVCHEEALALVREGQNSGGLAKTQQARGSALMQLGRYPEALSAYADSASLYSEQGRPLLLARARQARARVFLLMGRAPEALEEAQAAQALLLSLGAQTLYLPETLTLLAQALRAVGRTQEALESATQAVEALRLELGGLGEEGAGVRAETGREMADLALGLLADSDGAETTRAAHAFHLMESARGLSLAEQIVNRDALFSARLPEALVAEERRTRGRLSAALSRALELTTNDASQTQRMAERAQALREREAVVERIEREARGLSDVAHPRPVDLARLRAQLSAEEAVVLFHLLANRTLALVVRREGALLISLEALDPARVAGAVRVFSTPGSLVEPVASWLGGALLDPLRAALKGCTRLCICPDGPLAWLPFDALHLNESGVRVLAIERYELRLAPSATVLWALRGSAPAALPGTARYLGLGNPRYAGTGFDPLPASEQEVRRAAALFQEPARVLLLGEQASAQRLRTELVSAQAPWSVVHLACHALADEQQPRASALVLSGGEPLALEEVLALPWRCDLAVLSGCETARGRLQRSEGVLGLTRAFLCAGARSVLAASWALPDVPTGALIERFFELHLRDGLGTAAALRQAKRDALAQTPEKAHPSQWAGFALWGGG